MLHPPPSLPEPEDPPPDPEDGYDRLAESGTVAGVRAVGAIDIDRIPSSSGAVGLGLGLGEEFAAG